MKILMVGVFGGVVGSVIFIVSPYSFMNWEWWVALLIIVTAGIVVRPSSH